MDVINSMVGGIFAFKCSQLLLKLIHNMFFIIIFLFVFTEAFYLHFIHRACPSFNIIILFLFLHLAFPFYSLFPHSYFLPFPLLRRPLQITTWYYVVLDTVASLEELAEVLEEGSVALLLRPSSSDPSVLAVYTLLSPGGGSRIFEYVGRWVSE